MKKKKRLDDGGILMNDIENLTDISENDQDSVHLVARIKEEFIKKLFKKCLIFGGLGFLLVIALIMRSFWLNETYQFIFILINVFLTLFFAVRYIIDFTYQRISPSLIKYLINELNEFGFKVEMRYHNKLQNSLILTPFFLLTILINLAFSFYLSDFVISVLLRFFIMYIFILLIIPILTGKLNDRISFHLRLDYYISIFLRINLFKHRYLDSNAIKIHMKSSLLFSGKNAQKLKELRKISEKRRLKKSHSIILLQFKTKYYFDEKSTIINYKRQFINLVLAIREWDQFIKH